MIDEVISKIISFFSEGLIKIQNFINFSPTKIEKRNYKNSVHQESRNLFSKVTQEVNTHNYYQTQDENKPQVVIKMDGFTHNTGRLDLIFENVGNAPAVIKMFRIGENDTNLGEFTLSTGAKVTKQVNVSGFKILSEKLESPNFEIQYKNFSTGTGYYTVGTFEQTTRADGKFNLGLIKNITFGVLQPHNQGVKDSQISKLETKVLQKLYKDFKETGSKTKWKATDAFEELGLKDGSYVGLLSSSKFISTVIDGTHECFVITDDGIRYMEGVERDG